MQQGAGCSDSVDSTWWASVQYAATTKINNNYTHMKHDRRHSLYMKKWLKMYCNKSISKQASMKSKMFCSIQVGNENDWVLTTDGLISQFCRYVDIRFADMLILLIVESWDSHWQYFSIGISAIFLLWWIPILPILKKCADISDTDTSIGPSLVLSRLSALCPLSQYSWLT